MKTHFHKTNHFRWLKAISYDYDCVLQISVKCEDLPKLQQMVEEILDDVVVGSKWETIPTVVVELKSGEDQEPPNGR